MTSGEGYKSECLNKYTQSLIITFSVMWAVEVGGGKGFFIYIYIYIYIQGVTGGTDQTSGECSLGQTIPI